MRTGYMCYCCTVKSLLCWQLKGTSQLNCDWSVAPTVLNCCGVVRIKSLLNSNFAHSVLTVTQTMVVMVTHIPNRTVSSFYLIYRPSCV